MKKKNIKLKYNIPQEESFNDWIKIAEKSPKMSLEKFNKRWEEKMLQMQDLFK